MMPGDDQSLFEMDIPISESFADTREWQKLQKHKNSIARDIFLAIGATHLRSQFFYPDCFALQAKLRPGECQCCGQPTGLKLEGTWDLLRALKTAQDDALRNPWPISGNPWYAKPGELRAGMLRRELRLRELLECVQGRRHIRWHVNRKAANIKHSFEFTI